MGDFSVYFIFYNIGMFVFCFSILFLTHIKAQNYTNASSELNRSLILLTYSSLSSIHPYLVEI